MFARDTWNAERASWRSVIQLNLVRSITTIVETLQAELDGAQPESDKPSPSGSSSLLNGKHQLLKIRLGPLRRVETDLKRKLGAQADEEEEEDAASPSSSGREAESQRLYERKTEFGVCRWTDALSRGLDSQKVDHGHSNTATNDVVDEMTEVIASCKDDMVALWSDQAVRTVLKNWNVRLEDSAGL